ncbi:ESAT-6 protein secretion system EspG family protein [Pseudomonas sp. IT-P171]
MPLALWLSFDGGRFNLVQAWRLAVATALVLTLGYFLYLTASDKISQADTAQKLVNLQAQVAPQVVSQAGIALMAIALALALGRIDRFVYRIDHLGDLDALHVAGQLIATTGTADAGHQIAAAQFGEQLFEVGQGDALALGDIGQGHRPVLRVQRQIEHGGHGVSAFCSQSHGQLPRSSEWGEYAIPEYLSQL